MHKILFTGPESSGKTTLASWTAIEFNSALVPEYSRYYLSGRPTYTKEDVLHMLRAQVSLEEDMCSIEFESVVVDTSVLVFDVWLSEKFNSSIDEIGMNLAHLKSYSHIFLCKPDFPWVMDPLRENPSDRDRLFELYLERLNALGLIYIILEGSFSDRKKLIRDTLDDVDSLP